MTLYEACKEGNIEKVNDLIKQNANDWNSGLCGACIGGHLYLANLMINKGANNGLYGACYGGHLELVNLMINKGATKINK